MPHCAAADQNPSVRFFDDQFRRQVRAGDYALNPFETAALPYVRAGRVLDYGCGLGNLAVQAARMGSSVLALDASHAAMDHLRQVAEHESLRLDAIEVDLRLYELAQDFDAIVCIGLLMFFDCPTASRQLAMLQARVRPGGVAVINVLTEGTTFMDMFVAESHCLFKPDELRERFADWQMLSYQRDEFTAPRDTRKVFVTAIARKPGEVRAGA